MVEKSTLFRRTLFDVTSVDKKSMLFQGPLFDVISMGEKSTELQITYMLFLISNAFFQLSLIVA